MKKSKPIRMCIACRKRDVQEKLVRFQKKNDTLISYSGKGRSFYICSECIKSQHIEKIVSGRMKINRKSVEELLRSYK